MASYRNISDYLSQTAPTKWDLNVCFQIYLSKEPSLSGLALNLRVQRDLHAYCKSRPQFEKQVASFLSSLKAFEALQQNEVTNLSSNKIAEHWQSQGEVTINQVAGASSSNKAKTPMKRKSTSENDDAVAVSRGQKKYSFIPQMKPSTSTEKPRITTDNHKKLTALYSIKISDETMPDTASDLIESYERNKDNQAQNASFKQTAAYSFLQKALGQKIDDMNQYLWTHGYDSNLSDKDKNLMQLVRLVLTDFWAIASKPKYPTPTNERTPFAESIVPLFKYLSAVMNSVAFVCLTDGPHTEEDTLKLLESTAICLNEEKARYQQASYNTFAKRRIFSMQVVGYKVTLMSTSVHHDGRWACLWERSALVPSSWNQRMYWLQTFELLAHLMNLLDEQDVVTETLVAEHNGCMNIAKEDTLRFHHRKQST